MQMYPIRANDNNGKHNHQLQIGPQTAVTGISLLLFLPEATLQLERPAITTDVGEDSAVWWCVELYEKKDWTQDLLL